MRKTALILGAVAMAAALSSLATISHGLPFSPRAAGAAVTATLLASLPPLGFGRWLSNGAAKQLAVVSWRLAVVLPALGAAWRFEDTERKCYLVTLLVCYFVALPLESWLLIREARQR